MGRPGHLNSAHWGTGRYKQFNLCCPHLTLSHVYSNNTKDCKNVCIGPGWIAQLVRASPGYTKVVTGLIPSQSTYKKQPMNE